MFWALFQAFFLIGAFSFGGGYAMFPLIQEEVVFKHGWLTMSQFADIVAVAEMTPGPVAINTATYVGYKMAGLLGAAFATTGVVLPSFMLIISLAGIIARYKNNAYFKAAFSGLRPIVVSLIIGAAFLIGKETIVSLQSGVFALLALLALMFTKIHPILLIIGFGLAGILVG